MKTCNCNFDTIPDRKGSETLPLDAKNRGYSLT